MDTEPSVSAAPAQAHLLGATAFSFNIGNMRSYRTPPYSDEAVAEFKEMCARYGYGSECILPHSAFVVNLGSPDSRKLNMSRLSFVDELLRCEQLGVKLLNFHPGSHLKQISEEESLDRVAASVNYALERSSGVTAVIENTAGQGSALGYSFEHLAYIIERVEDKSRVGVCIDTCHATAAGYDLSTRDGYVATWDAFEATVGFKYLRGMHLNDALKPVGSRVDRHASIGQGTIGSDFFGMLMEDSRFDGIPMILETPDPSLWHMEIDWLRSRAEKKENKQP